MKAYEVTGGKGHVRVVEGVRLSTEGKIVLGEEGPGRSQVSISPPPGGEIVEIQAGIWYPAEKRLGSIPARETDPAGSVVVLFRDLSGYRGTWYLCHPSALAVRLAHSDPSGQRGEGHEQFSCLPCREAERSVPPAPLREIARGWCAQGDAGRMGGGEEVLLVVPPGWSALIIRSGRLYGEPSNLLLSVGQDGSVTLADPKKDAAEQAAKEAW